MESPCKMSEFFGAPGTGMHSYRIMNIAVVDALATAILAVVLAKTLPTSVISKLGAYPIVSIAFILFVIGIVAHRVFCVRTTIDRQLFD